MRDAGFAHLMRASSAAHSMTAKGAARLHLVSGVALLRPDDVVFAAMHDGWRDQQAARNLSLSTIAARLRVTARLSIMSTVIRGSGWRGWWTSGVWTCGRYAAAPLHPRGYQESIRLFCDYLTDPAHGWVAECQGCLGDIA
jgi:hypothetical protein